MAKVRKEKEVVPGLSTADVKEIVDSIFMQTDENHPFSQNQENRFIDILENHKPDSCVSGIYKYRNIGKRLSWFL